MSIEIGNVFKTQAGNYLRLEKIVGILFHFILVTKDNEPIPEELNFAGRVVVRSKVSYTEETVSSFKKQKIQWQK